MDGRYVGAFYRPLVNASFALDHALSGLEPTAYLVTNALLFGLAALAVHLLARSLDPDPRSLAPWVALVVFRAPTPPRSRSYRPPPAGPSSWRSPSSPSRSPSSRAGGAASGCAWPSRGCSRWPPWRRRRRPSWPPPWASSGAGRDPDPAASRGDRLRDAARGTAPHAAALGIAIAARWAVLGGMGGHPESGPGGLAGRLGGDLAGVAGFLLAPQPAMRSGPGLPVLVLSVLGGAGWVAARARTALGREVALGGLAIAWILLTSGIYSAARLVQPWYLVVPLVGWALLAGALAQGLTRTVRSGTGERSVPAAAGLASLALGALLGWQASWSPWVRTYPHWPSVSMAAEGLPGRAVDPDRGGRSGIDRRVSSAPRLGPGRAGGRLGVRGAGPGPPDRPGVGRADPSRAGPSGSWTRPARGPPNRAGTRSWSGSRPGPPATEGHDPRDFRYLSQKMAPGFALEHPSDLPSSSSRPGMAACPSDVREPSASSTPRRHRPAARR